MFDIVPASSLDRWAIAAGVTDTDAWLGTDVIRASSDVRWEIARANDIGNRVMLTTAVSTTDVARSTNYNSHYAKTKVSNTGTLLSGTKYAYRPIIDGVKGRWRYFTTRWPNGTPGHVKYLFAACFRGVQRTPAPIARSMARHGATTCFVDGDLTYTDIITNDIKLQRAALLWYFLRNPYMQEFLDQMSFEWMWDDHDCGGWGNINAAQPMDATHYAVVANTLAHFKEAFPHGDLVNTNVGTRIITDGVVETLLMDCRVQRSQTNTTFLGNATSAFNQIDWLLNTYLPGLAARDIWHLNLDFSTMIDATNARDGLLDPYYLAEFTSIIDAVRDLNVPSVWIKYGDRHAIFANDGLGGADLSTGGGAQIVQWCAAGLEANSGMDGSPLSTTFNGRETFLGPVQRNYSTFEFNYLPRTQIVVKGFAEPLDEDDNATEVFSIDSTEVTHTVEFDDTSGSAGGGSVSVGLTKNFPGPIGALDGSGNIATVDWTVRVSGGSSIVESGVLDIRPNCGVYTIPVTTAIAGRRIQLDSATGITLGTNTTYTFT